MEYNFEAVTSFLGNVGFWPLLGLVYLIGMYFFWREARFTGKDRNSTFDLYIFAGAFSLLWGRVSYILSAWVSEYAGLPWFMFPYERYVDGLYIFRLLPWRFFRIWDGGVLFTGLFLGFFIVAFLYSVFVKKWSWKQMMAPVVLSSNLMFGLTISLYGALLPDKSVYNQGLVLLGFALGFILLGYLNNKFLVRMREAKRNINSILLLLFTALSTSFLYRSFTTGNLSDWDKINVQAYVALMIAVSVLYLFSLKRKNISIEGLSIVKPINVATNQSLSVKGLERRRARLKGGEDEK